MEYLQLDKTTQLAAVRTRIRDLERQHLSLSLRIRAPDLGQPISEMDPQNLAMLETSLAELRTLESSLTPNKP